MAANKELDAFIAGWTRDNLHLKPAFLEYRDMLEALPNVSFEFHARPGISYSLRAKSAAQSARPLFVLVDVVDDEADSRWLSVCFYADMITDPDEIGDFVPKGLLGEDATCFNLDEDNQAIQGYIADRIKEAAQKAAS